MIFTLLQDIARPHWFDILASLKRGQGKAVGEVARELGASYMGIKQHCQSMVAKGLLESFRRPRKLGRPERIYRLTPKAQRLFPQAGNELVVELLKAVGEIHGIAAPEKLLFKMLETKGEAYRARVKGKSVVERATAFCRIREAEGYLSRVAYDKEKGFRIEESHDPLGEVWRAYPTLLKAEDRMVEQVVGAKVTGDLWRQGGQTVRIFQIRTL
jgi:predicted ArsR family transcriptional regulator